MTGFVLNLLMVYQFIKRLVLPFEKWEAFKQGVIDKDGEILIKSKDRNTIEKRDSLRMFDIMILKLKRLLGKIPFGKSKLASFAAALWLVKESEKAGGDKNKLLTEQQEDSLEIDFLTYYKNNKSHIKHLFELAEDAVAPVNVSGNIAKHPTSIFTKKKKKVLKRSSLVDKVISINKNKKKK